MTISTGKGGRYRYYKCADRINNLAKGSSCQHSNIPMEKLDGLILDAVANRVFTPERVEIMMKELQRNLKNSRADHDEQLKKLTKELDDIKAQIDRLYEAVEKGLLPLDGTLQERAHKHQARRQEVLTDMAGIRRQKEFPLSNLGKKNVCFALKDKLIDTASSFGKEYLKLLVDEIRVDRKEVLLKGSYSAIAGFWKKQSWDSLRECPALVLYGSPWWTKFELSVSNCREISSTVFGQQTEITNFSMAQFFGGRSKCHRDDDSLESFFDTLKSGCQTFAISVHV